MGNIEMFIDSIRLAIMNYQRRVILKEKEGKRYLIIWVDDAGADAIGAALQKVRFSDPYTWNPLGSTASNLGAVLKYVVIDESKEKTLQAKAFIEKEGIIEIDCKVSAALAGAVRADVPIFVFVNEEILNRVGVTTDEINTIKR
ncbi:bifunctional nuclease family protein [Chloroflexota bacterium]